ncbi:Lrp/AsnC family transcriptional regulator [Candidatus Woesearchaeota archaeon]|nr:Lrp/AsnC family transcriptional regulator [Candidatus Woesearchaeota archaeon]
MKNITPQLVKLLKQGYCTPQISRMAKRLKEPAATIHYNIKKMEQDKVVKSYSAVFAYDKIDAGFCNFVLISISPDEYGNPERIGEELAKHPEVESVDICTGGWELVLKVRTRDQNAYYDFVRNVISRKGVVKITSLTSLRQLKSEWVT